MADISITAANVLKSAAGISQSGIAGATITQGVPVYQLANGTFGLSDSNGTAPANSCAGMALNAASSGQPFNYVSQDPAYVPGGTFTSGAAVYVSNTPGGLTTTYSDVASGSTVIVIGVTNTDGTINLKPVVGGVK